jgi:hypothetical protein
MPKRLINLTIDEVSTVDRGAGVGVRIALVKSEHAERSVSKMFNNPIVAAEAAVAAVEQGRISQLGLNTIMKCLCDDTAGGSMAKFLDGTHAVGNVFLRPRQTRTSVAKEWELQKAERPSVEAFEHRRAATSRNDDDPKVDWNDPVAATKAYRAEKRSPTTVHYHQVAAGTNGDGMDRVDWSDDKQATAAYRAEKAAKERAQGSHQGENSRGERRVTGAHVNPRAVSP